LSGEHTDVVYTFYILPRLTLSGSPGKGVHVVFSTNHPSLYLYGYCTSVFGFLRPYISYWNNSSESLWEAVKGKRWNHSFHFKLKVLWLIIWNVPQTEQQKKHRGPLKAFAVATYTKHMKGRSSVFTSLAPVLVK
jgi:hypothetical protein